MPLRGGFTLTGNSAWDWATRPTNSNLAFQIAAGTWNPPVVTVEKVADAAEGGDLGSLVFRRTGDVYRPLTVNFQVSGSATESDDFAIVTRTITFEAGEPTAALAVRA